MLYHEYSNNSNSASEVKQIISKFIHLNKFQFTDARISNNNANYQLKNRREKKALKLATTKKCVKECERIRCKEFFLTMRKNPFLSLILQNGSCYGYPCLSNACSI